MPEPFDGIESLGLSNRARNSLHRAGVFTVAQLSAASRRDLLDSKGLGVGQLAEIVAAMERCGMRLAVNDNRGKEAVTLAARLAELGSSGFVKQIKRLRIGGYDD